MASKPTPAPAFNVGDIVSLKSGGPPMTVEKIIANAIKQIVQYRCQWFAGKKLEFGLFAPESLKKDDPPQKKS